MNKLVLLFIGVALVSGVFGLRGEGPTPNSVWVIFFASVAAAVYFFWKNRGEGDEASHEEHSSSETRGQSPRT
jgi:hypothetical protein